MPELTPGALSEAVIGHITGEGVANVNRALEVLANTVERQAKINASNGSHKKGDPTPATPGHGPAVVTGNLRRSITHETAYEGVDLVKRIGVARTAEYGRYLETGLRNGSTFPFLQPAFRFVVDTVAPGVWAAYMRFTRR